MFAMSICLAGSERVAAAWYFGVAVGANTSGNVDVESRSNDRASICDEYINPLALSVAGCTTPSRGTGDGWLAPFDSGAGFSAEAELGLNISSKLRVASLYSHNSTEFNQTVSSTDATGVDFDKINNELSIGQESLGSVTSDELMLLIFRDWPNRTKWMPYAGFGALVSHSRMDFSWLWARSADASDITTGSDQPNADEIRRNLAGTVSAGRKTLRDTNLGYVLAAGVDRELSQNTSIGIKVQWKNHQTFESNGYVGDLLRSHPPNLRRDGSELVSAWSQTSDTARLSAMLTIRYMVR